MAAQNGETDVGGGKPFDIHTQFSKLQYGVSQKLVFLQLKN